MVGRKKSSEFDKLDFTLKKCYHRNAVKYTAFCAYCGRTLKNTAAKRLILHRRKCTRPLKWMGMTNFDLDGTSDNDNADSSLVQTNEMEDDDRDVNSASSVAHKCGDDFTSAVEIDEESEHKSDSEPEFKHESGTELEFEPEVESEQESETEFESDEPECESEIDVESELEIESDGFESELDLESDLESEFESGDQLDTEGSHQYTSTPAMERRKIWKYWGDPNDLVDRLRLVITRPSTDSVGQWSEILCIINILRRGGYIE